MINGHDDMRNSTTMAVRSDWEVRPQNSTSLAHMTGDIVGAGRPWPIAGERSRSDGKTKPQELVLYRSQSTIPPDQHP